MEGACEQLSGLAISTAKPVKDSQRSSINEAWTKYLLPVYTEHQQKKENAGVKGSSLEKGFQITEQLAENVGRFIWKPNVFKADRCLLKRIHLQLIAKVPENSTEQTDFDDLLKYHPMEVVSVKLTQAILLLAMIEPEKAEGELASLEKLLEKEPLCLDDSVVVACTFVLKSLKQLCYVLVGHVESLEHLEPLPNYEDLEEESRNIVSGLCALYIRAFRRHPEVLKRLKLAAESIAAVEWTLYAAETLRLNRRDNTSRKTKASAEELELISKCLQLDPSNPYVRMNIIDCVVDVLREWNGRFHCGDHIHLNDTEQAMRFLQNESTKLCEEFPKNVYFLSLISDYFTRFVPFLYMDMHLAKKHMMTVYELNPKNFETTHRLSILYRMHFKDRVQALAWLVETLQLEPGCFKAQLDYLKTCIGMLDQFSSLGKTMEKRLNDNEISNLWTESMKKDMSFYIGLAYFAEGMKEDTLRLWIPLLKIHEANFALTEVDADSKAFSWDSNLISTEKIRQWINDEVVLAKKSDSSEAAGRKENLTRMFYLMLGVQDPVKPDHAIGPYSEGFGNAFKA